MLIRMVCPAPPGSLYGNRVTAERWRRILAGLGHGVRIVSDYDHEPCDLLIALHAKRSAQAVFRFRARYPEKPLVVALTGTDLYRDLRRFRTPGRTLAAADRIVALQPLATAELEPALHDKVRVIYQSAKPSTGSITRSAKSFDVSVAGHLRTVKDPFRAAYAARRLPGSSQIRILHAGSAMTEAMEQKARAEQASNPRYTWLGPLSAKRTRRLIAQSHLMVISSRMEGGANVISEAIVDGTPVLASRIPGSVGLLGNDYPGYFPVGNTGALAELLYRAETDSEFYSRLRRHCAHLKPLFRPQEERARWRKLLSGIAGPHTRK